jgi:tetratricopeptide (TPR) repeat protein
LDIKERIGDLKGKATTLNNIAGILEGVGQVEKALELRQDDLAISRQIGDIQGVAIALANIAQNLAVYRQDFDTAIAHLKEALTLYQRIQDPQAEAIQQLLAQVLQMRPKQKSCRAQGFLPSNRKP